MMAEYQNRDNAEVILAFVGDVALGNHPKRPGFGFYSKYKDGVPNYMTERLFPDDIRKPDIVFGNLEFALRDAPEDHTKTCCLGKVSYVPFLRHSGFNVLNVANNHSWQYGGTAFSSTVWSLKNAAIKVAGIATDFDPGEHIRTNNGTIAFLGCSARPRQGFAEEPGYNEFNKGQFIDKIRKAGVNADLVCVSIHWGDEFVAIPSKQERKIAHEMIDAGANIVVGHHPHVLREIEEYKGGLIAYSLGNFICDMTWNPVTRESGCLYVRAKKNEIRDYFFRPAIIEANFFPRYLQGQEAVAFLQRLRRRYNNLEMKENKIGYRSLAKAALRRHQMLTMLFMIKNILKYHPKVLRAIIYEAFLTRISS